MRSPNRNPGIRDDVERGLECILFHIGMHNERFDSRGHPIEQDHFGRTTTPAAAFTEVWILSRVSANDAGTIDFNRRVCATTCPTFRVVSRRSTAAIFGIIDQSISVIIDAIGAKRHHLWVRLITVTDTGATWVFGEVDLPVAIVVQAITAQRWVFRVALILVTRS